MSLRDELALWRAAEQRLAQERRDAWDKDPGNTNLAHVFFNAHGYHFQFKAWVEARDRVAALEAQLAKEEAA